MKKTVVLTIFCAISLISILTGCESGSEELCDGISVFGGCQTVNDNDSVDETPAVDEIPAVDETPAVDEIPAVDEAPTVDEIFIVDETPTVDETPITFIEVTEAESFVLEDGREVQAAKDEILIYLKEDITQAEYDNVVGEVERSGATVLAFNEDLRVLQIRVDSTPSELSLISEIETLPGVNSAGLNEAVVLNSSNDNATGYTKSISKSQPTHSLTYTAQATTSSFPGDYWIEHIDLEEAWTIEDALPNLSNVTIGIVDTGIGAGQKILEESRLTRYDKYGTPISDDDSFGETKHGLWTTAFAAGFYAESNTTGVSRKSKVMHIDVYEGQCSTILNCSLGSKTFTSYVLTGIVTAIKKGADIINISLGDSSQCSDTHEQRLAARQEVRKRYNSAVAYARREDKLLLFPAGNNCEKQDNQLLPTGTHLEEKSWLTHVVIVATTDSTKKDALFSGMGEVVNLVAPGKDIGYGIDNINSGTSFSTSLTTGVAAIIKGINGTLSAPEIRHILIDAAEPTVSFADVATAPNILLNARNAANIANAKSTRDTELESLSAVSLPKNDTRDITFSITLPATPVNSLDVVFLIDVSSSYNDDINTLQNKAKNIINDLKAKVADVQFGVASFSDFPLSDYGNSSDDFTDKAYVRNQKITSDVEAVKSAIDELDNPLHGGGDAPESQLEALYQVATGAGRDINRDGDFTDTGDLQPQSIAWRTGTLRIVFLATDASFHNSERDSSYPGAGKKETIAALQNVDIRVIGLQSTNRTDSTDPTDPTDPTADISSIVNATKGSHYFLSSDSAEIADKTLEGLDVALEKIDITIEKISGSEWITNITPMLYSDVLPGSERQFIVSLLGQKSSSIDELQYDIYLWVMGDGSALLKRVKIPVFVPAKISGS
ncbi:MAG: S8 family serine peptidase [Candidatus Parabeggiatoa sp.]